MKRARLFLSGVLMAGALDAAEAARSIADAVYEDDLDANVKAVRRDLP